tara:strand:- start:12986 stop:14080 length:1095 start_codon:yes stop_codon:yes gene_type:complete
MILMNDFKAETKELHNAMSQATQRVLNSGWYILGKEVEKFEIKWARFCGVSHAVGVGNGMDAIEIALRALNIGPGDEVITTPMTAFATVLAIYRAGAIPILADIESGTALLSQKSVERCITKKTKAIILVHLYGQLYNMDTWQEFCNKTNISLIEDCAQAHLAKSENRYAGSFGIAGAFSFYPTKNLSSPGDAGILITSNDKVASDAIKLRNYGQSEKYNHTELGLNSRLDEIHAAILLERLKWLKNFTVRRQIIAKTYREEISNSKVKLLNAPQSKESHVYHLFVINCTDRDSLTQHLLKNEIQTLIHYPVPIHFQEACKSIGCDPSGLPVSEYHAKTCLSLPCHPQMTDEDIQKVIKTVNTF